MVSELGVIFTDLYSVLFAALNSLCALSQKGRVLLNPQLQILYLFPALSLISIFFFKHNSYNLTISNISMVQNL